MIRDLLQRVGRSVDRRFLGQLAEGVSRPPWSATAAGVAVAVSFGGIYYVPEVLGFLDFWGPHCIWPGLIRHLPMLCCLGYLARRANTTVETAFGLRPVRVRRVMLSGLLLFVLATIWMLSILGLLTWLGLKMGPTASGGYMRKAASSFFVFTDVAVWAPLCEELACRGLLYTSLRTRCGITSSTVLTAAIFTSLHNPGTLVEICGHFFPAALFSLWYERTRSLWPNVIAHALHNGMPALYLIATRTCI